MQRPWWVGCALALVACGRIAQGTDEVGSSNDPLDCTYGKIASVPGLPLSVASTGKTIFVVSYDVAGDVGDLRAITSDGAVHVIEKDDVATGMVVSGSSLVVNRRNYDQQQQFLSATVDVVDPTFTISQLDSTNASVLDVDALIGDGLGNAYWDRESAGTTPNEPAVGASVSLEKYTGNSVATISGPTSWGAALVTDGTDYYGIIGHSSSFVISRLAVGNTPELVLANDNISSQSLVVGVDDTDVVYFDDWGTTWAVEKNGQGTPRQIADLSFMEIVSPILHDHHLYWAQQNADGTSTLSRVSTSGSGTVEIVATESGPVPALAVDACGVVYVATDSASPGLSAASIFRAKF
jgi:hypothetical protein